MDQAQIEIRVLGSLSQIAPEDWDACACPEAADGGHPCDPFTTHRFLKALEDSASVGRRSGWQPQYLVAYVDGMAVACAPMYGKTNSQGEYIFDHSWAHAYERAGQRYYPKLQIAVPFTPATGRRFLVRPGYEEIGMPALLQAAVQIADDHDISSLHITFCTEPEAEAGAAMGLLRRTTQQFHWEDEGYGSFDGFLASLSSRKRKNIRKEREGAQAFGGIIRTLTGDEIEPHHWDSFWTFYQDTGSRKWGSPYLTRAFFDIAHEILRDDIALVLAERNGRPVAGALNYIGRDTLFGRYWGCTEHHPFLHFELCYYRAIDYALEHGLARVEAGAQGEHKLARGYLPTETHSLHWIADPGFAEAVSRYLASERRAVAEEIEVLTSYGPFRRIEVEEQGMTEKLSEETRGPLLTPLFEAGWKMVDGRDAITKTYHFADFVDAFGWMTRVAFWAEKWNHHPEWFNVYKSVKVVLVTHDVNGLSTLDARLARKMDALAPEPLPVED